MKTTTPNGLKTRPPSTERRGRARLESHSQNPRKSADMGRPNKEPDTSTYPGRVSARLRELRKGKRWEIEDLQAALAAKKVTVSTKSLYAYELGKKSGGADVPMALVPHIAEIFGFKTAHGWLPTE